MRKTTLVLLVGAAVAVAVTVAVCALLMSARDTYRPTFQADSITEAVGREAESLYYWDDSMQSLMGDGSRRYFLIDWDDDATNVWLDIKECALQRGELVMTPHCGRLPDFAGLRQEVERLPANSILFYGTDDVGPILDAITAGEMVLLNRLLRGKGGRLYCFPGG